MNRVLLWTRDIDHLIKDDEPGSLIGGIHVQMYMWGRIFIRNGWEVFSFTKSSNNANKETDGFLFKYLPEIKILNPFITFFLGLYYIVRLNPRLIIVRGAVRDLFLAKLLSFVNSSTVIEMFASNTDLEPGRELIDRKSDRFIYRMGLHLTRCFVVQNTEQEKLLKSNYNKRDLLLVPQIWISNNNGILPDNKRDIILWVSNFRKLKRPEWFISLAKENPDKKFVMVGFPGESGYFEHCRQLAAEVSNIDFQGGQSFHNTSIFFSKAMLFVCTSEIEGFPNTFIQSWLNGCPVLTTFDPGNTVQANNLGIVCKNQDELFSGFRNLVSDNKSADMQSSISDYCRKNLDPQVQYERLVNKFEIL